MGLNNESVASLIDESPLPKEEEEENGTVQEGGQAEGIVYQFPYWDAVNKVLEELRYLWWTTSPILLTTLLLHLRSTISTYFLGRLGSLALAGGTIASGFTNITGYSIYRGMARGMDPICSQAYGAKRLTVLSQTYQRTLILLLIITIPITFIWVKSEPLLHLFGQDPSIIGIAKLCILYSLPDLLANAFLQPLRNFLRAQNLTKPLSISAALALAVHYPISYLLVVTLDMGVKGVALANAVNTVNLNLGLLIYLAASKKAQKPWVAVGAMSLRGWRPLLKLVASSVMTVCLEWWWYEVIQVISGLLSDPESTVAAMGIMIQATGLMYVFPSSMGLGLALRVGHELGGGRPDRARRAAACGMWAAAVFGVVTMGVAVTAGRVWARVYSKSEEVLRLTEIAMVIAGVAELGNSPQTAGCGVLTGCARPGTGWKVNLGAFYMVGLPVALGMAFGMGMGFAGLWIGLVAAQATCMVLMVVAVVRTNWDQQAERARELTIRTTAVAGGGEEENNEEEEEEEEEEDEEDLETSLLHGR